MTRRDHNCGLEFHRLPWLSEAAETGTFYFQHNMHKFSRPLRVVQDEQELTLTVWEGSEPLASDYGAKRSSGCILYQPIQFTLDAI